MLAAHLDQSHDLASRRAGLIDRHVAWIHGEVFGGDSARVLELACGPGLYLQRLAVLGHECVGIDFAPAAIRHANETAAAGNFACSYRRGDIRQADFGEGFDLVLLIYGQLNVCRPAEAADILRRAHAALAAGGRILLEPQTFAHIEEAGQSHSNWSTAESGLFAAGPHLLLQESFWDAGQNARTERFFVVEPDTGAVARHAMTTAAYSDEQLAVMLADAGFRDVVPCPSLTGEPDPEHPATAVLLANR
jgi:SAM-dependent methyltransferase